MEDTLDMNLNGTACSGGTEAERANPTLISRYDNAVSSDGTSQIIVLNKAFHGDSQRRKNRSVPATGLTGREYQVLRMINTYGWCTSEMVRRIANIHGIAWTDAARRSHQLLRSLEQSELVVSKKVAGGNRTRAYAATERGMRYILAEGDALLCDTNAIKDPASSYHFLGLNRIMIEFRSQFPAGFWLSDFEVRSDNSFIGVDGLAKDYDSVAELVLPAEGVYAGGRVRFGIEYERSQQSASRYMKLNSILASEKRLQFVLFFLNDPRLRNPLTSHLKSLVGFVYFVEYDRFLQKGMEAQVYYWHDGKLHQAPLNSVLKHASQKPMRDYVPVHQLDLRVQK